MFQKRRKQIKSVVLYCSLLEIELSTSRLREYSALYVENHNQIRPGTQKRTSKLHYLNTTLGLSFGISHTGPDNLPD